MAKECCHCGLNNLRDQGEVWRHIHIDDVEYVICEDCWNRKFKRMLSAHGMAFFMAMDDLCARFEMHEEQRRN